MRAALSFLTVAGRARAPGPGTLDWFPLVGAALGAVLGVVWWGSARAWPDQISAAVVVAADLALTGLLHLDGLVDTADGLLPPLDRDRRLAAMAAPEAGAFGVGAAGAVLLLRWAALYALRPAVALMAGLWCLSRTAMAAVARTCPYARPGGGLATAFDGPTRWPLIVGGFAGSVGLCMLWRPAAGGAAAGAAAVGGGLVVLLARRRLGGYTGDVLGATAIVAETVGLVVAAAKW